MKKQMLFSAALTGALLMGAGCASSSEVSNSTPPASTTAGTQGRAVFMVTDDSSLTDVTAVAITVDKLEVHSAANGWVTVSSAAKTYDLLKLKHDGVSMLLADAKLDAGTYDQVRLDISSVNVTAGGKTVVAKLPSRTLKIVGNLVVVAGGTSTASLDFDVDKSLHVTGSGTYILAPVVKWETKMNTTTTVKADESVEVKGGEVEASENEGQDVDGETKMDFELPEKLDVDSAGHITVHVE